MAIQKDKELANGAAGNYWKIAKIVIEKPSKKVTYVIVLFKDKAHADLGAPLGLAKKYEFQLTSEEINANIIANGYAKIKAKAASMVLPVGAKQGDPLTVYDSDLVDGQDV